MANRRAFERLEDGSFVDPKKEEFSKLRASGKSLIQCAAIAGIDKETGQRWGKRDDILERVNYFRSIDQRFSTVSIGYVVSALVDNAKRSAEEGQFKASNEALMKVYAIIKQDKDVLKQTGILDERYVPTLQSSASSPAKVLSSVLREKAKSVYVETQAVDVEPDEND